MNTKSTTQLLVLLFALITVSVAPASDLRAGNGEPIQTRIEGHEVTGLLWANGSGGGVVLSHGAVYDAASWTAQAKQMAAVGLTVLALDEVSADTINAAGRYLKQKWHEDTVSLIGASAGGATALEAVAKSPSLWSQLILLSPAGGNLQSAADELPILVVASEDEGLSDNLREAAKLSFGTDDELFIVPGSAHAQAIFKTKSADTVMKKILARLGRCDQAKESE